MGNDLRERLEALSAGACAGPWEYRPYKYDDWGMIRGSIEAYQGPVAGHEGIGPPVAKSNAAWPELGKFDKHRENDTDPMQPNGHFIVALVNAFRSGRLVTRSEMEAREAILVKALRFIDETICWEINTGNYDHSDVCEMDRSWCEIGEVAEKALDSVADHPLEQQTFTRSEMEEAVAKAVAEEREACAKQADALSFCDSTLAAKAIRARSEQKEGE